MSALTDAGRESEAEAWEALFDTDAARCCSCPACNHYLPKGEYQPDSTCVLVAAIERIITFREAAALRDAADNLPPDEAGRRFRRILRERADRIEFGR